MKTQTLQVGSGCEALSDEHSSGGIGAAVLEYYSESKSEGKEERTCPCIVRSHSDGTICLENKGSKITRVNFGPHPGYFGLNFFLILFKQYGYNQ